MNEDYELWILSNNAEVSFVISLRFDYQVMLFVFFSNGQNWALNSYSCQQLTSSNRRANPNSRTELHL